MARTRPRPRIDLQDRRYAVALVVPVLISLAGTWVIGAELAHRRSTPNATGVRTPAGRGLDPPPDVVSKRGDSSRTALVRDMADAPPGRGNQVLSLESAGRFFLAELERKLIGDWRASWQNLYPLHRRVAPLDAFVRCEHAEPFPAPLQSIRVVRTRGVLVRVAGLSHPVPGAAVTVAVELEWYGPRDPITLTHTFHLAEVEGRWTWLLSREKYSLYVDDACFEAPSPLSVDAG